MKASNWLRRSSLATLALVVLAGCENGGESGLLLEPKHEAEQVLISWKLGNGYTVVSETDETVGRVEGVIGREGGVLTLGEHILSVPAYAVSAPTTFKLWKEDGDHVRIHLTATRYSDNDIGRRGFDRPVRLMLSYKDAQNVGTLAASQLQVMYIRDDQKVEILPSLVNYYDRWVGTDLYHFSEYGIGWPNLTRTVTSTVGGLVGLLF